jgi:hypothetical protein
MSLPIDTLCNVRNSAQNLLILDKPLLNELSHVYFACRNAHLNILYSDSTKILTTIGLPGKRLYPYRLHSVSDSTSCISLISL